MPRKKAATPQVQPLERRELMAGGVKPLPPVHSPGPNIIVVAPAPIQPAPKPGA